MMMTVKHGWIFPEPYTHGEECERMTKSVTQSESWKGWAWLSSQRPIVSRELK